MKFDNPRLLRFLLWAARISGTGIAMLILYFTISHLANADDRLQISSLKGSGILQFVCFPVSLVAGYLIALPRPKSGAIIVLAGQVLLFLLRSDLLLTGFEMLSVPAILYLLHEWKSKKTGS